MSTMAHSLLGTKASVVPGKLDDSRCHVDWALDSARLRGKSESRFESTTTYPIDWLGDRLQRAPLEAGSEGRNMATFIF